MLARAFLTALRAFLLLAGRRYGLRIDTTARARVSQSGRLYNVVHSIHCIYYVTLYNPVQLLYNYAYCDLPYWI